MVLPETNFDNRSFLAIESDLEAIEERELHSFYPNNDSLMVSTGTSPTSSLHSSDVSEYWKGGKFKFFKKLI